MLLPLRYARINPDLMDYLPDDIDAKIELDRVEKVFGKFDPVIIFFESDDVLNKKTLQRIYEINRKLSRLREFDEVISVFETKDIRGEFGMMVVDPAIKRIPSTADETEELRKNIMSNELAYKLLISEDFRHTIMIVNPVESLTDSEVFAIINNVLDDIPGDEKVYMNGLPYLRDEIQKRGTRDLALLMPLGLIVMIVFLYFSFRQFRSVFLPFSVVTMSIIVSMGLMPVLGYELSLIAVLVPIMLISIANNYGIHIVARYQEPNAKFPDWSMKKLATETVSLLKKPVILTALTTIIGVMGLYAHVLMPARHMGIVASVGIAYALILSLLFIPSVMSYMKKGKQALNPNGGNGNIVDKMLERIAVITTGKPKTIIFSFLVFFIIGGIGMTNLNVSINLEKMLPSAHPMRVSTEIANQNFGGTKNTTILFEGDILDPVVMKEIDSFEQNIKSLKGVGNTNSIAGMLRIISKALNDPGEELYDTIPYNRPAIAQYIELYNMSGDPEDFEKFVNFEFTKAVLNVQFKADNLEEFNYITETINQMIKESAYASVQVGQPLLEKEISESIVKGQVYSLLFALIAITILLFIIFRSYKAGLFGALPLLITIVCNFGLMGWAGLELDIATSLLTTVAIGIGVDYTIHFFWRAKQELAKGANYNEAITTTLTTTGRGIAINAFSVITGFAVLFLSGLVILKTFAFLIIFSILLCLLGALVLIPAICVVIKPKFLLTEKTQKIINP